jgi:hypothetical protein
MELLIFIVIIAMFFFMRSAIKEEKSQCDLHQWQFHELDGHMYCALCGKLPFNKDGERV